MVDQKKTSEPFLLPSDLEEQRSIVERPDYVPRSTFRLPSEVAPEKPDYEQMPIYQAAWEAIKSSPKSLYNQVIGLPMMAMNPSQTWKDIKSIGTGALSAAAEKEISALESGAAGETGKQLAAEWRAKDKRTPEQKAEIEDPWNRFKAPYTSWGGFKEALATDPFSVIPLGGGPIREAGSILRGGKTSSLARKAISAPVTGLGYAVDPVETTLKLMGYGGEKAFSGMKAGAAGFTQVPEEYLDIAYMTGKSRGPQSDIAKKSFQNWFNGEGDIDNFQTRTHTVFNSIKNDAFQQWKRQKQATMAGAPDDVPLDDAFQALDEIRGKYGDYNIATDEGKRVIDEINKIRGYVNQRALLPEGHPGRSVKGLDELKIQLGKGAESNPQFADAYNAAYNGIKKSINKVAPEYQSLMDSYQEMDRHLNTIQKAIKAKNTASAFESLNAFNKLMKTPEGQKIAYMINERDPTILPSVAGAALSKDMPKLRQLLDGTGIGVSLLHTIYQLSFGGNTGLAIASGMSIPVLAAIQTPKTLGTVAYRSGQIAGSPVGKTISGVGSFARQTASPTATFMENLRRTQEDIEKYPEVKTAPFEVNVPVGIQPPRAVGGRIERAAGGKVDINAGVKALMNAAENAKKSISKTTESLLEQPDERIAQALNVAKRHI